MSASLSHAASIVAESRANPSALAMTRMEFVADGAGNYTLTPSLQRDAGFVVSGGNYTLAAGTAADLIFVRTASPRVLIYPPL